MVGREVWICVLLVIFLFFIGMFRFVWINICFLVRFRLVILIIDMVNFFVDFKSFVDVVCVLFESNSSYS